MRLFFTWLCCFGIASGHASATASPLGICLLQCNDAGGNHSQMYDQQGCSARPVLFAQHSTSKRDHLGMLMTCAGLIIAVLPIFPFRRSKNKKSLPETTDSATTARESETYTRLLVDDVPVLMWVARPDRVRSHFNKEWIRFTGRTAEQESRGGWTRNIHPADLGEYLRKYNRAFDTREKFAIEYRLRHNTAGYRWVLEQGVPTFKRDGKFTGYVGCCLEITHQKTAERIQAELSGRLIRAQEDERARIARELHDDINQRLALLANGTQELEQAAQIPSKYKTKIRALWRLAGEISADIQDLSHQLHPSKMHYLGLATAVRGLCQEFSRLHKIEIECIVQNVPANLDEGVALNLFRTAQEALRNVAKHSQARHAKVELLGDSVEVRLRISDDGVGFRYDRAKRANGLGLVSMEERLKLIGGRFSVWSRAHGGTQVGAVVPFRAKLPKVAS